MLSHFTVRGACEVGRLSPSHTESEETEPCEAQALLPFQLAIKGGHVFPRCPLRQQLSEGAPSQPP